MDKWHCIVLFEGGCSRDGRYVFCYLVLSDSELGNLDEIIALGNQTIAGECIGKVVRVYGRTLFDVMMAASLCILSSATSEFIQMSPDDREDLIAIVREDYNDDGTFNSDLRNVYFPSHYGADVISDARSYVVFCRALEKAITLNRKFYYSEYGFGMHQSTNNDDYEKLMSLINSSALVCNDPIPIWHDLQCEHFRQ